MIFADLILDFSEGRAYGICHLFQKYLAERIAKESKVKMFNWTPGSEVTSAAFRDEGMDMRIPLEVPTESVKNTDKTGSKVFRVIRVIKHTKNDISNRRKQKVQERTVI